MGDLMLEHVPSFLVVNVVAVITQACRHCYYDIYCIRVSRMLDFSSVM